MVKKMNTTDSSTSSDTTSGTGEGRYSSLLESQLANSVKESAHQIWLAGMGAFAKAQEEGGKVFEALVKEGSKLQKKTQGLAEDKIGEVTEKMSAMADTVTSRAGQNWDKLEAIFEQRTAKALTKLGVPTAQERLPLPARFRAHAPRPRAPRRGLTARLIKVDPEANSQRG